MPSTSVQDRPIKWKEEMDYADSLEGADYLIKR